MTFFFASCSAASSFSSFLQSSLLTPNFSTSIHPNSTPNLNPQPQPNPTQSVGTTSISSSHPP
ncbi:hypothetical protein BDN70DRAFT_505148 [Pholiota conissans]|uniref:Uncharacterized protein n=1 Tax=Pholiota conissans TaxID=109636 RepID=A0A9P5YNJ2_9AGAR|nr:hypothetical protein BDN70DRAFT_505148 [Pholiota conissans]